MSSRLSFARDLEGLVHATSGGRKIVAGVATPAVTEKEPNCLARVTASGRVSGIVSSEGGGLCTQRPATIVATTWASRSSHGSRSTTTRSAA